MDVVAGTNPARPTAIRSRRCGEEKAAAGIFKKEQKRTTKSRPLLKNKQIATKAL